MGVATGCGCKEVHFLILLIPTPLVSVLFYSYIEERRRCQIAIFYFARCVRKLALYSDVIHLFDWKSAVEHDGGV